MTGKGRPYKPLTSSIKFQLNNKFRQAKTEYKKFKAEVDEHREHCCDVLRDYGMHSEEYDRAIKKQVTMEQELRTFKQQLKELEQTFNFR